jgi:prophage DNA circulation protein
MAEEPGLDAVRRAFADLTGALEDAAVLAAEAQAAASRGDARQRCEDLITAINLCLGRLQRLKRRLE